MTPQRQRQQLSLLRGSSAAGERTTNDYAQYAASYIVEPIVQIAPISRN